MEVEGLAPLQMELLAVLVLASDEWPSESLQDREMRTVQGIHDILTGHFTRWGLESDVPRQQSVQRVLSHFTTAGGTKTKPERDPWAESSDFLHGGKRKNSYRATNAGRLAYSYYGPRYKIRLDAMKDLIDMGLSS